MIILGHMFWQDIWYILIGWQREINRIILGTIKGIQGERFWSSRVQWLFIFSFLYGIVHAAGPGHGKIVLCTNLLGKEKGIKSALVSASVAALTHVVSAVILTILLRFVFEGIGHFGRMNLNTSLLKVNGIIIMLLGLVTVVFILFPKLRKSRKHLANDKLMGVFAGMVPCPATMTLLMISMAHSVLWAGLLAVSAVIMGIFLTLLVPSLLTVLFKDRFIEALNKSDNRGKSLFTIIGMLQAAFFIIIGLVWIV